MYTNSFIAKGIAPLLLSFTLHLAGQNMVTNATFEAKHLNNSYGQLTKANGWTNANAGTADLFDKDQARRKHANSGIPNNYMGYQPSSDGQNYAGLVAYYDDGAPSYAGVDLDLGNGYKRYTEYLEGELREPMVAGMIYQVSFRINLANNSGRAVSCMGALISSEKIKQNNNTFLSQVPQFVSHRVIDDTLNWVILSGAYIATGGEKYITIGCFRDNDFMVEKVVGNFQNDSRKAYYYVSEVSVVPYAASKPRMDAIVLGVDYVELMDVEFASGQSEITSQFSTELDEVAAWMIKYPDYKFFIAGYTDQQGSAAVNDPLSLERARSVKKYLVNKGVNEKNIITDGFGSGDPIEPKMKSRKNRRVEIYLYTVTASKQS